jgi:hypothetical protein
VPEAIEMAIEYRTDSELFPRQRSRIETRDISEKTEPFGTHKIRNHREGYTQEKDSLGNGKDGHVHNYMMNIMGRKDDICRRR